MKKQTADTVMVRPFNKVKLLTYLARYVDKEVLKANQYFVLRDEGMLVDEDNNLVLTPDSVYSFTLPACLPAAGSPAPVKNYYQLPVYVHTKTKTGTIHKIVPTFYYFIDADLLALGYCLKPVTLREFMGSRFNYNPRISKNTQELLKQINQE